MCRCLDFLVILICIHLHLHVCIIWDCNRTWNMPVAAVAVKHHQSVIKSLLVTWSHIILMKRFQL